MNGLYAALAGALVMHATGAAAQTVAAPTVAPVLVPAAETPMLRIGTKVPLKLAEELTTKGKHLRVGQHFQMETAEPVMSTASS